MKPTPPFTFEMYGNHDNSGQIVGRKDGRRWVLAHDVSGEDGEWMVKLLNAEQADPLKPPLTVLIKTASIAVHAAEFLSQDGHHFDRIALEQLMADPEVIAWLAEMDNLAFLPKKRSARPTATPEGRRQSGAKPKKKC